MSHDASQFVELPTPGNSTGRATVEALFRHRRLFLGIAGLVMLITLLVTFLTPRSFVSEMNILVRNARPDYLISPERSNGQITQTEVTEERVGSEMEVLRSRDIADVVIDPNWPKMPLSQRSDAEIKAHEKEVTKFLKHLAVESVRKSNVIRVTYVTTNPRDATATLDRLLAAFLAKQRDIERSTGASSFFGSEATRYKNDLDQAQEQLAAFQQNNQMVTLGTRETTLETQINALEDNIRATQVQIDEASDRVGSDKHQLALQPSRQSTTEKSVPNLEAVQQLTAILANYQNKRTELLNRYQPTDRLVVEVNKQIADTGAMLATARANSGMESSTDINPIYQQLKAQLATSISDLAALRGRMADLLGQRDRLKRELGDVEGSTVSYSTLQSRVAELESNYQLYTQKKNEAGIADAMNQQQLVNVAVAERPTYSDKRFRPQYGLNLALGLFTALFLGGCAVFFAELGRETISAPWELEAISRAPVLATVPFIEHSYGNVAPSDVRSSRPPPNGRSDADSPTRPVPEPSSSPGTGGTPSSADIQPEDGRAVPRYAHREDSPYPPANVEMAMKSRSVFDDIRQNEAEETRMQPSEELREEAQAERAGVEERRAAVTSYEQLMATQAEHKRQQLARSPQSQTTAANEQAKFEPVARDPIAHPVYPARHPRAARPIIGVAERAQFSRPSGGAPPANAESAVPKPSPAHEPLVAPIELGEPVLESRHRSTSRNIVEDQERSHLAPPLRGTVIRPDKARHKTGRASFVTYTFDPGDLI